MPISRITKRGFVFDGPMTPGLQAIPSEEARTDSERLHYLVGDALSSWSGVEVALSQTFHLCIGGRDPRLSDAAFNAAIAFNARLAMASAVATGFLRSLVNRHAGEIKTEARALQEEWKAIAKVARSESKDKRNKLAHYEVAIFFAPPDREGKQTICAARLHLPSNHPDAPATYNAALATGLDTRQVEDMSNSFHALANRTHTFNQRVVALLKQPL